MGIILNSTPTSPSNFSGHVPTDEEHADWESLVEEFLELNGEFP